MRFNRKKFIYLISPTKIYKSFYQDLSKVLQQKKVSFFQLRLKKDTTKKKLIIGRKIRKICKRFNVKFLVNDDIFIADKLNADGCHLGQKDMNIIEARKILKNKILVAIISAVYFPSLMSLNSYAFLSASIVATYSVFNEIR